MLPGEPSSGPISEKRERLESLLRRRVTADHPLSFNQRSLWFLYHLVPGSAAYNVPFAFRIPPATGRASLRSALEALASRHAILRTTYATSEPVQRVHRQLPLDFEEIEATGWSETDLRDALVSDSRRAFDLHHGPVWRIRRFDRGPSDHVLLLVFHHIAYDLWSMMTFVAELTALYVAGTTGGDASLPRLPCQYSDFARWQTEMLATDGERLWTYWKDRLSGELPVLQLSPARPRPPVQSFEGAVHRHELPHALATRIADLGRAEQTTLFTVLLAAFQVFLHRHSGQQDIIVGSPLAGRSRAEFEHVLGYFLNTVPLRARFSGDPSFRAFLGQTRQTVHGALEHQDYPLELVVERLKPARSASHTPLFQAVFVLNRLHRLPARATGARGGDGHRLLLEKIPLDPGIAQFDLSLEVDDFDEGLAARWEYRTDMFSATTIADWALDFQHLLEAIVENPDCRLSECPALTPVTVPGAVTLVPPRTVAEEMVAEVVREVLDLEQVSVRASFVDLGGDSFKAAQVHTRLVSLTGVDLGVAGVFESSTIERLAVLLEERLLEEVDSLEPS